MIDGKTKERLIRVAGILEGCSFLAEEDGVAAACERALEIVDEILNNEGEKSIEER